LLKYTAQADFHPNSAHTPTITNTLRPLPSQPGAHKPATASLERDNPADPQPGRDGNPPPLGQCIQRSAVAAWWTGRGTMTSISVVLNWERQYATAYQNPTSNDGRDLTRSIPAPPDGRGINDLTGLFRSGVRGKYGQRAPLFTDIRSLVRKSTVGQSGPTRPPRRRHIGHSYAHRTHHNGPSATRPAQPTAGCHLPDSWYSVITKPPRPPPPSSWIGGRRHINATKILLVYLPKYLRPTFQFKSPSAQRSRSTTEQHPSRSGMYPPPFSHGRA